MSGVCCAVRALCVSPRTGERIAFSHLISKKFVGETATLDVLREGQHTPLDVT